MYKILDSMGKRDSLYQLYGEIEFDEGYLEQAISEQINIKPGIGGQRQSNVAVMSESTPLEVIETCKNKFSM